MVMSEANSQGSITWISEDTVELCLGAPVDDQTLLKVEKLARWAGLRIQSGWLITAMGLAF